MREVPTVVARKSSVEKPKKVPSASHEHAYNRMISMGTLLLSSHMHDEDICANIRILWSRNLDRAGPRVVEVYQLKSLPTVLLLLTITTMSIEGTPGDSL
jgi:hypothetical protein